MHQFGLLHAGKVLRVALACAALVALSACATDPSSPSSQAAAQQAAAPVATQAGAMPAPASNTTVAELQGLIRDHKVDELRTIYNASYGASMLFKPDDLTYYVVLFQQRDFWQVYKTKSIQQADAAYRTFAARTAELAQADFDRIRLQAENVKAQELLNARMARLGTLQADDALRRQQDQEVAQRQTQIYAETDRLNQQQQIARNQLTTLQRQIEALQAEQNRLTGQGRAPASRRTSRATSSSRTAHKATSYRRTYYYHGKKRVVVHKAATVAPTAQPVQQEAAPQAEQEQDSSSQSQQAASQQPAATQQQAAAPAASSAAQAGSQPQSSPQSSQ